MAAWQIEATIATLADAALQGRLNLQRPDQGWHALRVQGQPIADAQLLQVKIDLPAALAEVGPLSDAYVRGADLVATYEQSAARPSRAQIYWRHLQGADCAAPPLSAAVLGGLELVVS